jgi:hypothetical protein
MHASAGLHQAHINIDLVVEDLLRVFRGQMVGRAVVIAGAMQVVGCASAIKSATNVVAQQEKNWTTSRSTRLPYRSRRTALLRVPAHVKHSLDTRGHLAIAQMKSC